MARSVAYVVRINVFSYAANVSYASLNIMFSTACKFSKLRACVAAILKKCIRFMSSPLALNLAQVYLSLT